MERPKQEVTSSAARMVAQPEFRILSFKGRCYHEQYCLHRWCSGYRSGDSFFSRISLSLRTHRLITSSKAMDPSLFSPASLISAGCFCAFHESLRRLPGFPTPPAFAVEHLTHPVSHNLHQHLRPCKAGDNERGSSVAIGVMVGIVVIAISLLSHCPWCRHRHHCGRTRSLPPATGRPGISGFSRAGHPLPGPPPGRGLFEAPDLPRFAA